MILKWKYAALSLLLLCALYTYKRQTNCGGLLVNSPCDSSKTRILHQLNETVRRIVRGSGVNVHGDISIHELPRSFSKKDAAVTIAKKKINICLDDFDSFDALLFVALHEIAHVATHEYGHTQTFWDNFKNLIDTARKHGHLLDHNPESTVCRTRVGTEPR